jgi:hypothetical protein
MELRTVGKGQPSPLTGVRGLDLCGEWANTRRHITDVLQSTSADSMASRARKPTA